jgi:hypothetical protein
MSSGGLKLITLCSYLTTTDVKWRPADYDASKMVKALKGDPINRHFFHTVRGVRRRFDQSNIEEFLARIPIALAKHIGRHVDGPATVVPIPNSTVTTPAAEGFKTLALARAVAKHSKGQLTAMPALVFDKPQEKSRAGGPRSPLHFESSYRVVGKVNGPIVLLDDVCTSGGHMVGAYWKLSAADRPVVLACAFGRTTKEQLSPPIALREELLDTTHPFDDIVKAYST